MSVQSSNKNRKWLYILLGVLVVVMALAYFKSKNAEKGEKVTVEKVQKRDIKEKVSASGRIFPVNEVKISSDVSGEIIELNVEEGDSVVKGQLLCRINPDTYVSQVERGAAAVSTAQAQAANARSAIESTKAQKEQTEAQLRNAKDILNRSEKLHKDGVISTQEYETAQNSVRQLEATLKSVSANIRSSVETAKGAEYNIRSAQAGLKEIRTSLNRTAIYAPTGGIISKLNVKKGERVVGTMQMTGTEIMTIANLNNMEVQVEVSENDIPRVAIDNTVEIELDAFLDRKFLGKVTKIGNSASNITTGSIGGVTTLTSDKVTNFLVKIKIEPSSYADLVTPQRKYPFRPGMSASVDIFTNSANNILTVPIQAVTTRDISFDEDKTESKKEDNKPKEEKSTKKVKEIVFVCDGNKVKAIEVKTGLQDDTYIQIISGLKEGEEVVSGPYAAVSRKLKDGDFFSRQTEKDKEKK